MNQLRQPTILIMFFFLLFASCEKTIEITDPSFDPMLVIVSNIAPHYTNTPNDNRIRVEISESQEPADNKDFSYPNDVRVYLTKRNVEDREELKKANSVNYFSSQKDIAVPDENYTIQVVAQGYDTITAETYIPKASSVHDYQILDFVKNPSIKNDEKINISYNVEFTLDHQENVEYYHIAFFNEYFDDDPATLDSDLWWVLVPEYEDDALYTPHFEYGILLKKDDFADDHVFSFKINDFIFSHEKVKNHWIEVRSVTEEYYLYHESLSRQKLVRQDPFAEPVIIFNNIKNGLGNFSGYNSDIQGLPQPE